jgi:hypothetical protein
MLPFLSPIFGPLFGALSKRPKRLLIPMRAPVMVFDVQCVGPDGKVKWREVTRNLVTNAGRIDLMNKYFKGASYSATWFMLLKGAGTVNAADTLASHAGWTEATPYAGNRPAITWGTPSGTTTVDLAGTAVSFSITGTATVAGAGCCTVNSGTSGTLYNISDFGASRAVASGDTLNVTPTLTAT